MVVYARRRSGCPIGLCLAISHGKRTLKSVRWWRIQAQKRYLAAMHDISTFASLGNRLTSTVSRAGGVSLKKVPYT